MSATSSFGSCIGPRLRSIAVAQAFAQERRDVEVDRTDWSWSRLCWLRFSGIVPLWPGCDDQEEAGWCARQSRVREGERQRHVYYPGPGIVDTMPGPRLFRVQARPFDRKPLQDWFSFF